MAGMSLFAALRAKLLGFRAARTANIAITFALALVPVFGALGAAVDFSRGNSVHAALQNSLDATALNLVKSASSLTASQINATANSYTLATFNRPETGSVSATGVYDGSAGVLTLTGSAVIQNDFMGFFGFKQMNIAATSQAKLAPKTWPVCVLVTSPASNHTLLTRNAATINFDNCMVQVNTLNWDAVEARDTSYIHSTNGDNCFVGEIHYGDITPPKDPTCTFFTDPFSSYMVTAGTCLKTGYKVTTGGTTLAPGTYCNGLTVQASTTFGPGLYVIKDGLLNISGSGTNITANGVTFLLTGNNAGFNINTKGTFTQTPAAASVAGTFGGFLFYLDQAPGSDGKTHYAGQSVIQGTQMTANGIVYLVGQQFQINSGANVTIDPGSIVAGFILPDGGNLTLTGTMNTATSAEIAMQKTGGSNNVPTLIK